MTTALPPGVAPDGSLMLTFAEIAFLLKPYPEKAGRIRRQLGLTEDAALDVVVAAGAASLVARGLFHLDDTNGTVPTDPMVVVAAALSTADSFAEAVSWTATRPVAVHLISGSGVRLALAPAVFGLFTVEQLDAREPLSRPVMALLDRCDPGTEAAVVVKATGPYGDVTLALVRDPGGAWFMSDTLNSPDKGAPTTREAFAARLDQLVGPTPVGTGV